MQRCTTYCVTHACKLRSRLRRILRRNSASLSDRCPRTSHIVTFDQPTHTAAAIMSTARWSLRLPRAVNGLAMMHAFSDCPCCRIYKRSWDREGAAQGREHPSLQKSASVEHAACPLRKRLHIRVVGTRDCDSQLRGGAPTLLRIAWQRSQLNSNRFGRLRSIAAALPTLSHPHQRLR